VPVELSQVGRKTYLANDVLLCPTYEGFECLIGMGNVRVHRCDDRGWLRGGVRWPDSGLTIGAKPRRW
jgi:hypothetical protein